jgi:hypothetical protein
MNNVVRKLVLKNAIPNVEGPPRKHCKGWPICKRTLSARSKFDDCDYCRRADKKWGGDDVDIQHVITWHDRLACCLYRVAKHVPKKVASIVVKQMRA